ncbi:MAG: (deoxy)nucleoside triphosphate pyrophosphohydrolase [Candidatus Thermoplasmatota archaeon]|nr:(deoxy)nucleoside triphosphate pyrophosphohydrolase [Candidatus Thermoplasmatota archaeon]
MEGPVLVTAAVIMREGKLLITQRLPDSRFEPNRWEFPGGKVDFGEHPESSMKRELLEEIGIQAEILSLYGIASHVYDQNGMIRHVVIMFYRCDIQKGEPSVIDCQDLKWVSREELHTCNFVEGDRKTVERILSDDELWIRT